MENNNKLIAEFIGFEKIGPDNDGQIYRCKINNTDVLLQDKTMEFGENWSWIMRVVEQIDQYGASIIIGRMFCEIKYINPLDESEYFDVRIASGVKINAVYGAVVDFINWYNAHKKQK